MAEARGHVARALSIAARALPKAERQKFREFLASLPGATPPRRRKVHSWHRKRRQLPLTKLPKLPRPDRIKRSGRQLVLPLPTPPGPAIAGALPGASVKQAPTL